MALQRPLLPPVTVTQSASDLAVHEQLAGVVTVTLPVPPEAALDALLGDRTNEQDARVMVLARPIQPAIQRTRATDKAARRSTAAFSSCMATPTDLSPPVRRHRWLRNYASVIARSVSRRRSLPALLQASRPSSARRALAPGQPERCRLPQRGSGSLCT